jgi:4-hydroxy-3-methylbut-2-enyl diphosphate reductase IspH
MLGINVLVIVGSRESSFSGTLAQLAGENSPDGIRVSFFDSLDELPPFSETPATVEPPRSVDAFAECRRCGRCGPAHDRTTTRLYPRWCTTPSTG